MKWNSHLRNETFQQFCLSRLRKFPISVKHTVDQSEILLQIVQKIRSYLHTHLLCNKSKYTIQYVSDYQLILDKGQISRLLNHVHIFFWNVKLYIFVYTELHIIK